MKPLEVFCQDFTDRAWYIARMYCDAEDQDKFHSVYQECDFCTKRRGIGYILFTEDGLAKCIYCRDPKLRN